MTVADRLPKLCTIRDVCRALNISERQYYDLRAANRFPIPEVLPRLGRGPRFSGVDVGLYLEGHYADSRRTR